MSESKGPARDGRMQAASWSRNRGGPTMFVRMLQLPEETRTAYDVSPEVFVEAWQTSSSADEVAKKLKMPNITPFGFPARPGKTE